MTSKRAIRAEIAIVLLLSLGASAIYSLLRLLEALMSSTGIGGKSAALNPSASDAELFDFLFRLVSTTLGFVPVALVLLLLSQKYNRPAQLLGIWKPKAKDFTRGFLLFAAIGIPGLGLYLLARQLGLAAKIIPGEFEYFWVIPLLLLSALKAAAVEEVIMVGYLYKRFDELGMSFKNQQLISSAIRAAYHAYQGFAGILGNFVMGWVFGLVYRRWGRVLPLVIAHFLLDAFSFVGYALLAKQLATLSPLF